jgi:SAM-dependent methyltransferase
MGCVDQPRSEDIVADMAWQISRTSGVIQLRQLVPLDVLYQAQHDPGSVGGIWLEHHRAFAGFLRRYAPASVLEIGGAHGILAREYKHAGTASWTILEPNPAPVEGCDARFIRGFFDETFSYDADFDAVVHSHVFEHIYEPDQFMARLGSLMVPGKHLVFSLPNMQVMLARKYTNCLNFEHTVFLAEPYVEFLLAKHGFSLLAKEYFRDDHSIFYAAVRDPAARPTGLPAGLYATNRSLYLDFVKYHDDLIADLNRRSASADGPLYLFGAHIFAQYLITSGLDTSRVVSLLDNDPKKQGKRLYGTRLTVRSPRVLADDASPVVILKAGVYNDEIKADILANINSATTFLE